MTLREKIAEMDPEEAEQAMDRVKQALRGDVQIVLKVKPPGTLRYHEIMPDATEFLSGKELREFLCAVAEFFEKRTETREARYKKVKQPLEDGRKIPEAIVKHEKKLLIQGKVQQNRLRLTMNAMYPRPTHAELWKWKMEGDYIEK